MTAILNLQSQIAFYSFPFWLIPPPIQVQVISLHNEANLDHEDLKSHKPYDQFVRELIAPTDESRGFIDGIVWRGTVNASQTVPIQFAQNIGQTFLGINLKCASCHDSFVDRWTLIPIPYVRGQGDAKAFGFFLIDTNLFGRGKFITLGGTFGSGGNSGFLMYRDPSLFFSKWNGGLILRNAKQDSYNYEGKDEIEGFQERFISYGGYLGYKIYPKTTLGFSLSKDKKEFSILDAFSVPQNNEYFLGGVNFSYRGSQYKFYFKEGTDASLSFKTPFGETNSGAKGSDLKLNVSSQWNVVKNHALQVTLTHLQTFSKRFGYALKLGGQKGLRGLPLKGVWALRSSSLAADYQIPLYFSKYGTWTFSTFLDGASLNLVKSQKESQMFTSSYGIGATFFIKKVNFPGLGLFYGRNNDFLGNFVSFTLGRGE